MHDVTVHCHTVKPFILTEINESQWSRVQRQRWHVQIMTRRCRIAPFVLLAHPDPCCGRHVHPCQTTKYSGLAKSYKSTLIIVETSLMLSHHVCEAGFCMLKGRCERWQGLLLGLQSPDAIWAPAAFSVASQALNRLHAGLGLTCTHYLPVKPLAINLQLCCRLQRAPKLNEANSARHEKSCSHPSHKLPPSVAPGRDLTQGCCKKNRQTANSLQPAAKYILPRPFAGRHMLSKFHSKDLWQAQPNG